MSNTIDLQEFNVAMMATNLAYAVGKGIPDLQWDANSNTNWTQYNQVFKDRFSKVPQVENYIKQNITILEAKTNNFPGSGMITIYDRATDKIYIGADGWDLTQQIEKGNDVLGTLGNFAGETFNDPTELLNRIHDANKVNLGEMVENAHSGWRIGPTPDIVIGSHSGSVPSVQEFKAENQSLIGNAYGFNGPNPTKGIWKDFYRRYVENPNPVPGIYGFTNTGEFLGGFGAPLGETWVFEQLYNPFDYKNNHAVEHGLEQVLRMQGRAESSFGTNTANREIKIRIDFDARRPYYRVRMGLKEWTVSNDRRTLDGDGSIDYGEFLHKSLGNPFRPGNLSNGSEHRDLWKQGAIDPTDRPTQIASLGGRSFQEDQRLWAEEFRRNTFGSREAPSEGLTNQQVEALIRKQKAEDARARQLARGVGGALGGLLASQLFAEFGNDNVALALATSTLGNQVGAEIGQFVNDAFGSLGFDKALDNFGSNFGSNIGPQLVGTAGSFLGGQLAGLIFDDSPLANVVGSALGSHTASYILAELKGPVSFVDEAGNFRTVEPSFNVQGLGVSLGAALGAYGGQLAAQAFLDIHEGNALGVQVGGAVGNAVTAALLLKFTPYLTALGPVGWIATRPEYCASSRSAR